MKSAPAIAFDYVPSRWLQLALLAIIGLAGVSIAVCAAPMPVRGALILLAVAVGLRAFQRLATPWRRIAWHADETWSLGDAHGAQVLAQLAAYSRRGGMLILRLVPDVGKRFEAVLLPDNLDRELFRSLCVRLARGATPTPSPA